MENRHDIVRAPIASKKMKLIDDDKNGICDSDEYDSDNNENDIEKALRLSIKDVYGDSYEKNKKANKDKKEIDKIVENMQINKNEGEIIFNNLKEILSNDKENEDIAKKILRKITLYINGINRDILLESHLYYYLENIMKKINEENKNLIKQIIKPANEIDYIEYCFAMSASKIDELNSEEIKRRKNLLNPLLVKLNFLKKYDEKTLLLENKIIDNINSFINTKTDNIKINDNDDYKNIISIIESIKNIDQLIKKEICDIIIKN
jgi:hypothetical protein